MTIAPEALYERIVARARSSVAPTVGLTYFDGFIARYGEVLQDQVERTLKRARVAGDGGAVKVAETFGGGGLFALAWSVEGAELVDFVEKSAAACATVDWNLFPAKPQDAWDWSPPPGLDVLSGGPPCQPWSRAGTQAGPDDVRNAYPLIGRWLRGLQRTDRPRVVVLENAATVLSNPRFRTYFTDEIIPALEACRYEVVFWRLNSADFGDPQMRLRVFLVAWPRGASWGAQLRTAPAPSHGRPGTEPVTSGQVLPWVRSFDRLRSGCCGGYGQIDCRNIGNLHRACETCVGVMGELPANYVPAQGTDSRDLTPGEVDYLVRPKGDTGRPRYTAHRPTPFGGGAAFRPLDLKSRRVIGYLAAVPVANLARGVPYGLLTTSESVAEVDIDTSNPAQVRAFVQTLKRISVRQAARIMSVPNWYEFQGNPDAQYRQVGNGIPLGMGRAVTRHIISALSPAASAKASARKKWTGLWPLDRLATCQGFAGITAYPGELPTGTDKAPDRLARPYLDHAAVAAARAAKAESDKALSAWKDEGLGTETYQLEVLDSWEPEHPKDAPPGFPDFDYFISWVGGEDTKTAHAFAAAYYQHFEEVPPELEGLLSSRRRDLQRREDAEREQRRRRELEDVLAWQADVRSVVQRSKTWFLEDEPEDEDSPRYSLSWSTREQGDVGDGWPGKADREEARRLKAALEELDTVRVRLDGWDEWVTVMVTRA